MIRWFKLKFYQIKRVIDFFPIIWKGRDFDFMYAVDLFNYQLERLADFLESDKALGVDAKLRAQRIRTTLKLMQKVYNEEYTSSCLEQVEELYGEEKWEFIPTEDPNYCTLKIRNEKAVSEEHQKEIDEIRSKFLTESYETQKKAHRVVWKLVERNIQRWWD